MEITKRKHSLNVGIFSLWLHWAVGTGALVLPIVLALWMSKALMPWFLFLEMILLYYYMRQTSDVGSRCFLIINVCARTLGLSGIIMLIINFLFSSGHIYKFYDEGAINIEIPFIDILIISPCALLFSLIPVLRGPNDPFCLNCARRYGTSCERGFLGYLYKREGYVQMLLLAWLSGVETVYAWVYYFCFYINVNINKPDIFFFLVIPAIFYVASLVYMGLRYLSLLIYYSREMVGLARQKGAITQLRFLVICDNSMFLATADPGLANARLDTPFSLTMRFKSKFPLEEVTEDFMNVSHVEDAKMRYVYTSESGNLDGTIEHYLAAVEKEDMIDASLYPDGKWYTFYQIKQLLNSGELAPLLQSEVLRIYTIAMARKTYDENGKRLYKIKNYRPTFQLSQVPDMDVDFNNSRWLFISANNEDRRFFRWRKIMNKIFYGRDI